VRFVTNEWLFGVRSKAVGIDISQI